MLVASGSGNPLNAIELCTCRLTKVAILPGFCRSKQYDAITQKGTDELKDPKTPIRYLLPVLQK